MKTLIPPDHECVTRGCRARSCGAGGSDIHGHCWMEGPLRALLRFFRLQRSHVDGEAVFHIRFQQPVIGLVYLLHGDHFDIGRDVVGSAKVEHLLGLGNPTDG